MSKRSNGEGSIYRDKANDRWVGEVLLEGKRRRVYASTQPACATKLRAMITQHEAGTVSLDSGTMSVRQLVDLWLRVELPARKIAETTRVRFEAHARVVSSMIGDVQLRKLDAERVEAMYEALAAGEHGGRPWAQATLTGLRSMLSQVLRFGMRRGKCDRNIAPVTVIPVSAAGERRRSSLSVEDARTLYDACSSHERLGAMWQLGLLLGLRPGELSGLTWGSVTLTGSQPHVTISREVAVDRTGRPQLVEAVKTDGSYRTLGLPAVAVDVLRAHKRAQASQRLSSPDWADLDLVFCTSAGTPLSPSNVRRDLAAFCEQLDVPRTRPNELRHTAATLLLDPEVGGLTIEQVAALFGHRSTRMLERHYRHRTRTVVSSHVEASQRLFGTQA
jgi:integrase